MVRDRTTVKINTGFELVVVMSWDGMYCHEYDLTGYLPSPTAMAQHTLVPLNLHLNWIL